MITSCDGIQWYQELLDFFNSNISFWKISATIEEAADVCNSFNTPIEANHNLIFVKSMLSLKKNYHKLEIP